MAGIRPGAALTAPSHPLREARRPQRLAAPQDFAFTVEAPHLIKSSLDNYGFQPIPSSAALLAVEIFVFSRRKEGEARLRRRLEGWGCAGTRRDPAAPSAAR